MKFANAMLGGCLFLGSVPAVAMAAGAVTAVEGFNTLTITGDGEANSISVTDLENDGIWDIAGKGGTTVNGMPSIETGLINGLIDIQLAGGDDALKMKGGNIGTHLAIILGEGSDKASISGTSIASYFYFVGNEGDDKLLIKDVLVADGTDAFLSSIHLDGPMGIGTGGNDLAKIKNFTDQNLLVTLGQGDDKYIQSGSTFLPGAANSLGLSGQGGKDKILLKSVVVTDLAVAAGTEDDTLKIIKSTATTNGLDGGDGAADKLIDKGNSLGTADLGTPVGFEN